MIRALALGSVLCCLIETAAWGLCPRPVPKVCSSFFESDAVVVGTVVSEKAELGEGGMIEGWTYHLRVTRVLRGHARSTLSVHTENDSARLVLKKGQEYLLFAQMRNGRLEIGDDCGPLSNPDRRAEVEREIGALESAQGAVVEGEVLASLAEGEGVQGVTISILGSEQSYTAMTNAKGEFHIAVQPGRYRVSVDPKVAVQSDTNWVELENVRLVKGQCAQVLFVGRVERGTGGGP